MPLHVQATAYLSPDDPEHARWLGRLRRLVASAPQGAVSLRESSDEQVVFRRRDVACEEMADYLRSIDHPPYYLRRDACRMWRVLVSLHMRLANMHPPETDDEAANYKLPLVALKRINGKSFEGSGVPFRSRQKFMGFIAWLG